MFYKLTKVSKTQQSSALNSRRGSVEQQKAIISKKEEVEQSMTYRQRSISS